MYRRTFAFTLFELLLVLAILSAIAAVTIPNLGLLMGEQKLTRASEQLRIELTRTRVDAMRAGQMMMLQWDPDLGTLKLKPFFSAVASVDSNNGSANSQSTLLTGGNQASVTAAPVYDPEAEETIELPEGVTVEVIAVTPTARSTIAEQEMVGELVTGTSPILFYSDGTTSNAVIILAHPTIGRVAVKLRGITGDVTIDEVMPL
ncbi:hypothetical protein Q31b_22180 [Novipirellula aureliae]|uniref:General secretion pathway GspH domain-containing protein n=1 Tax=Novipirellula aureliae TaxID=2527966 RepID=A0A5C6E2P4_9BACT|nr:hypothetical protein Q31b_22180 [Novipirellula aureliae]